VSKWDASITDTLLQGVSAAGVTFFHVRPSSKVTWISPSSVPTHRRPSRRNDGAMV
jgi:hypothetical protein